MTRVQRKQTSTSIKRARAHSAQTNPHDVTCAALVRDANKWRVAEGDVPASQAMPGWQNSSDALLSLFHLERIEKPQVQPTWGRTLNLVCLGPSSHNTLGFKASARLLELSKVAQQLGGARHYIAAEDCEGSFVAACALHDPPRLTALEAELPVSASLAVQNLLNQTRTARPLRPVRGKERPLLHVMHLHRS